MELKNAKFSKFLELRMGRVAVLRFSLLKNSEKSFLAALDVEGIKHSRVQMFTTQPQASGVVEVISALSEAMPWNAIAKVMIQWIEARKSRKIIITMENKQVIYAEGYSIKELEKILPKSVDAAMIDTQPEQ